MKSFIICSALLLLASQAKAQSNPYWQWLGPPDSAEVDEIYASGDTIYAGTEEGFYGSFDGGKTWGKLDSGLVAGPVIAPAILSLSVARDNNSVIYISKNSWINKIWGVLYKSTDAGKTWQLLTDTTTNNTPLSQYYSGVSRVAVSPYDTSIVFADVSVGVLSDDELYRSTDGGSNWTFVTSGFPVSEHGLTIGFAFDPSDSMKMYATGNDYLASCLFYISTDGGIIWTSISPCPGLLGFFKTGTSWDILGWGGPQVISSTDGGYTWGGPIMANYHNFNIFDLEYVPSAPQTFYATAEYFDSTSQPFPHPTGVFRSTDSLKSWVQLEGSQYLPIDTFANQYDLRVFIDRVTGYLYVTSTKGLWRYYKPVTGTQTVSGPPSQFILYPNYPNPFNPTTVIDYQLPRDSHVTLKVYDILGSEVAALVDGEVSAGYHEVTFDGSKFASGVYFYRISAGSYNQTKKMLLIK